MVQIAGKPFTQLENLNLLDELRVDGKLVVSAGSTTVEIFSLQDFKDNAASVNETTKVIFLKSDVSYFIHGAIDLGLFNLVGAAGASVVGSDGNQDGVISGSSTSIFFSGDGSFIIQDMFIKNSSTSAASLFSGGVAGSGNRPEIFMHNVQLIIDSGQNLLLFGTMADIGSLIALNCMFRTAEDITKSMRFTRTLSTGGIPDVFIHSCLFENTGTGTITGHFLEFDSGTPVIFNSFHFESNVTLGDSRTISASGTAKSFMNTDKVGMLSDNNFGSADSPINDIDLDGDGKDGDNFVQAQWLVKGNIGIADSREYFVASRSAAEVITVDASATLFDNTFQAIDASFSWKGFDEGGTAGKSLFIYSPANDNQKAVYRISYSLKAKSNDTNTPILFAVFALTDATKVLQTLSSYDVLLEVTSGAFVPLFGEAIIEVKNDSQIDLEFFKSGTGTTVQIKDLQVIAERIA